MKKIGILALQGNYLAHGRQLTKLSVPWQLIVKPDDLQHINGLIIPGGESTALLNLMQFQRMDNAIIDFSNQGNAIFGTCAGMILLATKVISPSQTSLGLIDITVERNAYGRQIDSFNASVTCDETHLKTATIPAVFIRAPKIAGMAATVTPLIWHEETPVMVRQNNILVASFHPEMTDDLTVHRYFVEVSVLAQREAAI